MNRAAGILILCCLAATAAMGQAAPAARPQPPPATAQPTSSAQQQAPAAPSQQQSPATTRPEAAPDPFVAALAGQLRGNYRQALAAYEALLKGPAPRDDADRIAYLIGVCHAGLGEYRAAADRFAGLTSPAGGKASPWRQAGLLRAGQLYEDELTDPSRAREVYETVRAEGSDGAAAWLAEVGIGRTREAEGDFVAALQAYQQVLAKAGDASPAAAEEASARQRFIALNGDTNYTPLKLYVSAARQARNPRTRTPALLDLIRLAGLYPQSALVDDAFVELARIQLVKGDVAAARQAFERLLRSGPRHLAGEPMRSIALQAGGWLLEEVDGEIASEAEVFPELAGYKAGENVGLRREAGGATWRLAFSANSSADAARRLNLVVVICRGCRDRPATLPNLDLHVETTIDTTSDVLSRELQRAVDSMTEALVMLDKAVAAEAAPAGDAPDAAGQGIAVEAPGK